MNIQHSMHSDNLKIEKRSESWMLLSESMFSASQ